MVERTANSAIQRQWPIPKRARPGVDELSFARLVRFYGVDPLALAMLPGHVISVLERSIPLLRNEEVISDMTAARSAWLKSEDWKRALDKARDAAEPFDPAKIIKVVRPANDQVRAWFIANGIPIQ